MKLTQVRTAVKNNQLAAFCRQVQHYIPTCSAQRSPKEKFKDNEGVHSSLHIASSLCWCYGTETSKVERAEVHGAWLSEKRTDYRWEIGQNCKRRRRFIRDAVVLVGSVTTILCFCTALNLSFYCSSEPHKKRRTYTCNT